MSNPYYITPNNSRQQNLLGLASLAAQLYGLKQKGDIAEGELGVHQEKNRLTAQDIDQRGQIHEREAGLKEEENRIRDANVKTERMKIPHHKQNFGYGDAWQMKSALSHFGLNAKDETNPVIQRINELAKSDNVARVDAWQAFRQDPEMKQPILEAIGKKLETGMAKNPDYLETKEGKGLYEAMQALSTEEGWGKAVDGAFRHTVKSYQQEELNSKAALLEAKLEGQAGMQAERLAMSDKMNQERLVSAEERNKERIASQNEMGKLRAQTTMDVSQARLEAAKAIQEGKANRELTPSEKRLQEKDIRDTETKILTNKTKQEAGALVESFNENAKAPHFYKWQKGKLYGGEWVKTPLPKIKGKQVMAKDVYDTAAQRGMTYEEVLAAIGVK